MENISEIINKTNDLIKKNNYDSALNLLYNYQEHIKIKELISHILLEIGLYNQADHLIRNCIFHSNESNITDIKSKYLKRLISLDFDLSEYNDWIDYLIKNNVNTIDRNLVLAYFYYLNKRYEESFSYYDKIFEYLITNKKYEAVFEFISEYYWVSNFLENKKSLKKIEIFLTHKIRKLENCNKVKLKKSIDFLISYFKKIENFDMIVYLIDVGIKANIDLVDTKRSNYQIIGSYDLNFIKTFNNKVIHKNRVIELKNHNSVFDYIYLNDIVFLKSHKFGINIQFFDGTSKYYAIKLNDIYNDYLYNESYFFKAIAKSLIINLFWLRKYDRDEKVVYLNALGAEFKFRLSRRQIEDFTKLYI